MRRKQTSGKLNRGKPNRNWAVKNRPKPNWKLLLTVFFVSTVVALGSTYISTTPRLVVNKVVVTGVTWADSAAITAAGRQAEGSNVLFFNKKPIADAILEMPEVESVRVDRVLPKTVKLRVQERKPCALLNDGKKMFLVDDAGVAFHQVSKPAPGFTVIAVRGPLASGDAVGKTSMEACLALEALRCAVKERLSVRKILVDPDGDICLNMMGGFDVKLGQAQEIPRKMKLVRKALEGKPELATDAKYIDVSCPKYPAWLPKSASVNAMLNSGG